MRLVLAICILFGLGSQLLHVVDFRGHAVTYHLGLALLGCAMTCYSGAQRARILVGLLFTVTSGTMLVLGICRPGLSQTAFCFTFFTALAWCGWVVLYSRSGRLFMQEKELWFQSRTAE